MEVLDIPIANIEANPEQPRKSFPKDHIERLAASIRKRGLLQPITVRPVGKTGRFQIVAGECRWRAHALMKAETIRAIVKPVDVKEMQLLAIVENLQRRDMNPIEEGNAFQTLLGQGYTIAQIVAELGLTGAQLVQNRIDLLELTEDVQHLVATGQITTSMGWAIRLAPRNQQTRIVRDIAAARLKTVEQVRHACIALRDAAAQMDVFASMPKASKADLQLLSRLERRIDDVIQFVGAGFKDGECVAAQRVSPERVKTMADKLALCRKHILQMEHDLRCVATQREITLGVA